MMRLIGVLVLFLPFCSAWYNPFSDPLRVKTEAGREHFEQQEYEDALRQYSSALEDAPERPELHFNLGTIKHRQEAYEEAIKEYELADDAVDPKVAARNHYNRGNALFRLNDLQGALDQYVQALKLDPGDEDSKYNVEFVRRLMQQQQQQQQQQNDQQKDEQQQQQQQEQQSESEQNEQEQEQQQQQKSQEDQQKQEQEQQQQPEEQPDQQEQPEQQQEQSGDSSQQEQAEGQAQPQPEELTQEQAEMILNSLEQKERDERQEQRKKARAGFQIDRDW